jgi:hypothetical protein
MRVEQRRDLGTQPSPTTTTIPTTTITVNITVTAIYAGGAAP